MAGSECWHLQRQEDVGSNLILHWAFGEGVAWGLGKVALASGFGFRLGLFFVRVFSHFVWAQKRFRRTFLPVLGRVFGAVFGAFGGSGRLGLAPGIFVFVSSAALILALTLVPLERALPFESLLAGRCVDPIGFVEGGAIPRLLFRAIFRLCIFFSPPSSPLCLFDVFDCLLDGTLVRPRVRMHAFGREDFLRIPRITEEAGENHNNNNKGGGHDAKPSPLRRHTNPIGMPLIHFAGVLLFGDGLVDALADVF